MTKIDSNFPIIKENTDKIKGTIYGNAQFPLKIAGDIKKHVFNVYGDEYKKYGGNGVIASGKAAISASLVLSQESLAWITSFLQTQKDQANNSVNEKTSTNRGH